MLAKNGSLVYIVPISFTSSDSLSGVHKLLMNQSGKIRVSSYAVRPQPVFKNAVVNTSIIEIHKTYSSCKELYSTKMYRKSGELDLQFLVDNLQFIEVRILCYMEEFPKSVWR